MFPQLQAPPVPMSPSLVVKGVVQLYTNPGRGSFTPVMAQALRAAGQGMPVLVIQFLKGGISQGPERPVILGRHLKWVRCGIPRVVDTPHLEPEERLALDHLWHFTQSAIESNDYGLVVLDELALAMKLGLIAESEVLDLLDNRPVSLDVMITGPEMPDSLLDRADLITQLRHHHRTPASLANAGGPGVL